MFVFDFDQTLSVFHVFKALAGWGGNTPGFSVPPPHAMSEVGQLARVAELSSAEFQAQGGFAQAAFGGKERVQQLQTLLKDLRGSGAELILCTKGLVGTVNKCLADVDLLQGFSEVYGRLDGSYGSSAYDKAAVADESMKQHLGRAEQGEWRSKDKLMARLMESRGLQQEQAVLVEDDPEEVKNAAPVCRTLLVREAKGLQKQHFEELLAMARGPSPSSADPASEHKRAPQERRGGCSIL